MSGTYDLGNGIVAKYSASKQKSIARFCVRGTVSLPDPETGGVLKVRKRGNAAIFFGAAVRDLNCCSRDFQWNTYSCTVWVGLPKAGTGS